jgi:hypothetical protein
VKISNEEEIGKALILRDPRKELPYIPGMRFVFIEKEIMKTISLIQKLRISLSVCLILTTA